MTTCHPESNKEPTSADAVMPPKERPPSQSKTYNQSAGDHGKAEARNGTSRHDVGSQTFLTQLHESPAVLGQLAKQQESDQIDLENTSPSLKQWAEEFLRDSDDVKQPKENINYAEDITLETENDAGYDTDADKDIDGASTSSLCEIQSAYLEQCRRLGVLPVTYFIRNMTENDFVMRNHGLGPLGTRALATALEKNTYIERLNLEGNAIQAEGVEYLCKMLKENFYITDLYLAENSLGSEGSRHIFEMMADNHTIIRLDLSGNNIQDSDGVNLCAMLEANTSLKYLYLRNNHLADKASFALKTALSNNESLELLDISWNHIRMKGAVAVSEGVAENIGLRYLNLSMNGFGVEGATAMGKALAVNRSLRELDLSWNRIPYRGGEAIGKGLNINDILRVLKIGNNPLTAPGAIAVLNGIASNDSSNLDYLDLVEIFVTQKFVDLKNSTEKSRSIKVVHGELTPDNNEALIVEYDFIAAYRKDPMTVLKRYAESNGLRLVDLFRQFDKDNSLTVNRKEFVLGVRSAGIEMSEHQIDTLMNKLDKDGDGEIDYAELLEGDKKNRRAKLMLAKVMAENEEKHDAVDDDTTVKTVVITGDSSDLEKLAEDKNGVVVPH